MSSRILDKNHIEVHSSIVKIWPVNVKGYRLESKHRIPIAGTFEKMRYKDSWILTPTSKR